MERRRRRKTNERADSRKMNYVQHEKAGKGKSKEREAFAETKLIFLLLCLPAACLPIQYLNFFLSFFLLIWFIELAGQVLPHVLYAQLATVAIKAREWELISPILLHHHTASRQFFLLLSHSMALKRRSIQYSYIALRIVLYCTAKGN